MEKDGDDIGAGKGRKRGAVAAVSSSAGSSAATRAGTPARETIGKGGKSTGAASGRTPARGDEPAQRRARGRRVGDLLSDIGRTSFRRFGFVQSSIISRWAEIVGDRYARVSAPESIRFPKGERVDGVLTLVVEPAHAPMMQHVLPDIIERANRFFGYGAVARIVIRQDRVATAAATTRKSPPSLRAIPVPLGAGLKPIADPELRACLEALAGAVAATTGRPVFDDSPPAAISAPVDRIPPKTD